ncbi:transposase-like protein [Paenibacillus endophyticus]|uniref:Transposase-like protein n=1 Tax=Paenibacillus endophyticus TaxID=1294268 RepID=A0A7W5CDH5_9BACL|nr:transposase-like protein [Paenibacillus endophyticus]
MSKTDKGQNYNAASRRTFTAEFKSQMVQLYECGKSLGTGFFFTGIIR